MIRTAMVSLFATCTLRCGYCSLVETGQVLDGRQLEHYKNKDFVERLANFFNSRTTKDERWKLLLTGGEPLIAPNLDLLCQKLFQAGNSVAFQTSLHVGPNHAGWRLLLESSYPEVDFIMASLHPQAEEWEDTFFERVRILKERGHKVLVRFVAHPKRLHRLEELENKCRELDVCFFPAALYSDNYPGAYSESERELLKKHSSSLTQLIHLGGGIDTSNAKCYAGDHMIAVDPQSGNVMPCIALTGPVIGNVHRNELSLTTGPNDCPQKGINCLCDAFFEHDVVLGAESGAHFARQKDGFVEPTLGSDPSALAQMHAHGLRFYSGPESSAGQNTNDEQLVFPREYVVRNYKRNILGITEAPAETMAESETSAGHESFLRRLKEVMRGALKRPE